MTDHYADAEPEEFVNVIDVGPNTACSIDDLSPITKL